MKECHVLFDESAECKLRKCGKMQVCDYMNQTTGMCMHKDKNHKNHKQRKKNTNNNNFFRQRSDQTFALLVAKKESGYIEDVLPYRD
jgi:hypothetical protein